MNNENRELDLALAECEQENRLLRARNERLTQEVQLLTEALRAKQEQGEPVAWMNSAGTDAVFRDVETSLPNWSDYYYIPLYTTPQQRTWVGLTPEEVKEISLANRPYVVDMVVALETKLKEKNHGA